MAVRRGNRHPLSVDGQTIWLDSMTEEIALCRFIDQYGFAGKWERPQFGIKHLGKFYTPDFELAIEDGTRTSRALVEVKQYKRDCVKNICERMRAVAGHYFTKDVFLYTASKDEWYQLNIRTGELELCSPPRPGRLNMVELAKPWHFKVSNFYGRRYRRSFWDVFFSLLSPKSNRRRRRK